MRKNNLLESVGQLLRFSLLFFRDVSCAINITIQPHTLRNFGIPDRYYYAYSGRECIQALCGLDADTTTRNILRQRKA